jgi:hypothetical protein
MVTISVFHWSRLDLSLAVFSLSTFSMLNIAVIEMSASRVTPVNYLADVSNSLPEIFNKTHHGVILRA